MPRLHKYTREKLLALVCQMAVEYGESLTLTAFRRETGLDFPRASFLTSAEVGVSSAPTSASSPRPPAPATSSRPRKSRTNSATRLPSTAPTSPRLAFRLVED